MRKRKVLHPRAGIVLPTPFALQETTSSGKLGLAFAQTTPTINNRPAHPSIRILEIKS